MRFVDALIFAGGTGSRMTGSDRPKQFLDVGGKPILLHTIERFAYHRSVSGITVVCLESWIDYLERLLSVKPYRNKITVVPGGTSGQESIYFGLQRIRESRIKNTIVLVHDGVRPLIDDRTISDCISSVENYGSAITVSPAIETIVGIDENGEIVSVANRDDYALARAPQAFWLNDLWNAHQKAREEHLEFIDSLSMMSHYGYAIHAIKGPTENIKVTTPTDYFACKGYMDMKDYGSLWGGATDGQ